MSCVRSLEVLILPPGVILDHRRGSFAMMNHDELRRMAAHFRLIAMDGEDLYLVFALRQLAEEFDAEAAADVQQKKAPEG